MMWASLSVPDVGAYYRVGQKPAPPCLTAHFFKLRGQIRAIIISTLQRRIHSLQDTDAVAN